MTALNSDSLSAWLREQQLVASDHLGELKRLQERLRNPQALLLELVQVGCLTAYQADCLLKGKGGELVIGPYRVLDLLGEGGMGSVYKARHARMDRLVALKVIAPGRLANPDAVRRFRLEAKAAAQLRHDNIVLAYDADEVGGVNFLAMEYIEGTDLSRLVHQGGPLVVPRACEYARQTALGLQHAHEKGLVHRDIKPHNLIVTRAAPGAAAVVKILDFGLARFATEAAPSARLTQTGKIVGTVDYIAPEQVDDAGAVDIRADIYALGCTLYYLLTGRVPFAGEHTMERLSRRLLEAPPSVRAALPQVPVALDRVLLKMMVRDPGQRFQTPGEVALALQPFARSKGLTTVPTGIPIAVPTKPLGDQPTEAEENLPMAVPVQPPKRRTGAPAPPAGGATSGDTEAGQPLGGSTSLDVDPRKPVKPARPVKRPREPEAPEPAAWRRRRRWPWVIAAVFGLGVALAAQGAGLWGARSLYPRQTVQEVRLVTQSGPFMQVGLALLDAEGNRIRLTSHDPRKNDTRVRIDAEEWPFGIPDEGRFVKKAPLEPSADGRRRFGHRAIWIHRGIRVTQTVELVPSKAVERAGGTQVIGYDTCLVSYLIENLDTRPHRIGVGTLVDTMIKDNDAPHFLLPGQQKPLSREQLFRTPAEVPGRVKVLEKAGAEDPGATAYLTLKIGPELHAPDRFAVTAWTNESVWTLKVRDDPGNRAVVLWWDPQDLAPGASRHVGYGYGAGVVAQVAPGRYVSVEE